MSTRAEELALPDEILRNGRICAAGLVQMDFGDGTDRWWTGAGDLSAMGQVWQGTGDLVTISGLTSTYQAYAESVTFSMAATPEMVSRAMAATTLVHGRAVQIWMQKFSTFGEEGAMPWQTFGTPTSLWSGEMGPMTYDREGGGTWQVSLVCESVWVRRNAPPYGLLTDRDQQARVPGDKGLERLARYVNYEFPFS